MQFPALPCTYPHLRLSTINTKTSLLIFIISHHFTSWYVYVFVTHYCSNQDIEAAEEQDGIRFTLNVFPSTSHEAKDCVIPLASLYKPILCRPGLVVAPYEPIVCSNALCRAILNPHCFLDYATKMWTCRLCLNRSPLPPGYISSGAENLPVEVLPENSTIEYISSRVAHTPPIFLFVIDVCVEDDNLQALKESLLISLSLLPKNALVGLITFGKVVNVIELGFSGCLRSIAFNGAKRYASTKIQETLGFLASDLRPSTAAPPAPSIIRVARRYLLPIEEVEFEFNNALEQILGDPFRVKPGYRHERCTGVALNVAISMMEASYPNSGSRIMLFAGGPCTLGPGEIVEPSLKQPIRSHHDIDNDMAKLHEKASKYYSEMGQRAAKNGNLIDIFAGCYDQVGLEEMRSVTSATGGVMVLTDSFTTAIFKQSFIRMFNTDQEGNLEMGFLGNLMVKVSKELKISGLLGHAISLDNKSAHVAETSVGLGGTSSWKLCGLSPATTVTTFFDVVAQSPPTILGGAAAPQAYIQYATHYLHSSGEYRLRVTTIARPLSIPTVSPTAVGESFDQETAAAVVAKLAVDKAEHIKTAIRWIDDLLIRLCIKFAWYVKDDARSFKLPAQFTYFPQFIYHLRRSQFIQVFNNSPDETAYYRHLLIKEDTTNCCIMIQPTLTAYEIDKEPFPVLLDSVSVTADRILLLDTFFHILIYHGEIIAGWRRAGYQEQEDYKNFKDLLDRPRQDAAELLVDRFPLPRFIDTEAKGSQARFLFSRLNPSKSEYTGGVTVLTDDVSLQDFVDYLIKLVVKGRSQ